MKEFYLRGGLSEYIRDYDHVKIIDLDTFIGLVNIQKL